MKSHSIRCKTFIIIVSWCLLSFQLDFVYNDFVVVEFDQSQNTYIQREQSNA